MTERYQNLFLTQSYLDVNHEYEQSLADGASSRWDYVILTASSETQAAAYEQQIQYRLANKRLLNGVHYAVLPDPEGKRVGSGGATFNAIRYIAEHSRTADLSGLKILVVHSGGDSKRVPQYSACGKLFSPVPRLLLDGSRSLLFDELMIGMHQVAARMSEGMLVCSGDVLLLFNPLQIDFFGQGAGALSIKESVETGKDHGVYLRNEAGQVAQFLHKQPIETLTGLGAVDERGNVDIDTGAVILSSHLLNDLYTLVDTPEKFAKYVNEQTRMSFYADFLYPLASDSSLEQFQMETPEGDFTPELATCRVALWEVLHKYRMKLIRLSPAAFVHFGTTKELLALMTEEIDAYCYLGWGRNINTNSKRNTYAASNSYINACAEIGQGCYIEDSYIHEGTVIGRGCVISCVTLQGQTIPDGTVVHGLKLADGRFVVRMYGVDDNPKRKVLFGASLEEPLWAASIYPVCSTISNAVDGTLQAYRKGFQVGPCDRLSLMDSFAQADVTAIIPWQMKLDDKVKVESLLEGIDKQEELATLTRIFQNGLSARAREMLVTAAGAADEHGIVGFGRKMRIYQALSMMTIGKTQEEYTNACFDTICRSVLQAALLGVQYDQGAKIVREEVTVHLPVRVNWGGGWSDTPPYCMEHGGTVLNAAIALEGMLPIEVIVKRVDERKIVLASADNGSYKEFTSTEELQDSSNPYDPFALHKAALIVCGIIPYKQWISFEEIMSHLGSGLFLSTQVINIPRGSGLGTSSILAGACVKGLFQFIGKEIPDGELYNRVLCMEQIMSTGGGWQDQVGGLAPGIKKITSTAGMHQKLTCTPLKIDPITLKELNERFCLIYTGQRRLARNLLREVVIKYIAGHPETVEVLHQIQRMAVLMQFELEKGNVDAFATLLSKHWDLSKRLDVGCSNTCIEQIFLSIDDLIDGKMICGAGGGGFLQVVIKKNVTKVQLRERLKYVFQDSGVDVCESSFLGLYD